jgi:hypothetical protein
LKVADRDEPSDLDEDMDVELPDQSKLEAVELGMVLRRRLCPECDLPYEVLYTVFEGSL